MKTQSLLRPIGIGLALMLVPSFGWGSDHGAEHSSGHSSGPSPEAVLKSLKQGNQRFVEGKAEHPNSGEKRRRELASGQAPNAIVLSCADSRVPPELIFDQGLGEVFTVRVAGNVVGAATVASIEYAVEHLGSRLIVVLGHESCGAVKAALGTPPTQSAGSPDLDTLVSTIRPALEKQDRAVASKEDSKTLRKPVMLNVDYTADRLLSRSAIIRKHVEEGKVSIVRAVYSLESGKVDFWDSNKK